MLVIKHVYSHEKIQHNPQNVHQNSFGFILSGVKPTRSINGRHMYDNWQKCSYRSPSFLTAWQKCSQSHLVISTLGNGWIFLGYVNFSRRLLDVAPSVFYKLFKSFVICFHLIRLKSIIYKTFSFTLSINIYTSPWTITSLYFD